VRQGRVVDVKAFRWDQAAQTYVDAPLRVAT
jgi:hypothetical protein